jgi:amidase
MIDLLNKSATSIVKMLKNGAVSPLELLDSLENRIKAVDGKVNALPILCFDRARDHAKALMKLPVQNRGILAGMPIPIKDLTDVKGVRTTYGSPIFKDHVPLQSNILIENLEAKGGIVYAKSNTPEFGAGANTFNEVFGRTLNPWNTKLSCAGSSGGAAVALKTGMAWLAHGSDMGGSLRNPASFCGIVGLRPSVGRVASTRPEQSDSNLGQEGPMARNVTDLALLLDAMSGEDARSPTSLPAPRRSFVNQLKSGKRPLRVAYSRDLGITPVDHEVAEITKRAALRFEEAGVIVEEAHPDFSGVHESFGVLRAFAFALSKAELLKTHREHLKPEVIWNIEKGLALTMDDIVKAEAHRAELLRRNIAFYEKYDLLLTPATVVAAFPVENRFVAEINGEQMPDYVRWLAIVYAFTMAYSPALSLPCGFTADGRPVGLQIAAKPFGEADILCGAKLLEDILGLNTTKIIDPRG